MGKELNLLGDTTLISSCYGFETNNITDYRINSWYQKTSKGRKFAPFSKLYHQGMKHLEQM